MGTVLFSIVSFTSMILTCGKAALAADPSHNNQASSILTTTTTLLPQNSKTPLNISQSTTLAPNDKIIPGQEKSIEIGKSPKISWFGKQINTSEIADCQWPADFIRKYDYCFDKSFGANYKLTSNRSDPLNFGFGILNMKIMDSMMNCGKDKDCDMTKEEAGDLQLQYENWWNDIEKLIEFRRCLKLNAEASAKSCESDQETTQVFKGIAGLYLNLIDVIMDGYATNDPKNRLLTDVQKTCWSKTAEAVHLTAALYVKTQFYQKNTVLCWDTYKMSTCDPDCFTFGSMLECVREACPDETHFANLTVWSWFFGHRDTTKKVCSINETTSKCHIGALSSDLKNENVSNVHHLYEVVKHKYNSMKTEIETRFHVPFFIFILVVFVLLIFFTLTLIVICMWYNGGFGNTTVVRYAKVLGDGDPETPRSSKYRINVDETKSLTRNYDEAD